MQQRILALLMGNGVTVVDPGNTWIDNRVQIGQDTVIEPFTCIYGETRIGKNCRVGPFGYLRDAEIEAVVEALQHGRRTYIHIGGRIFGLDGLVCLVGQ